MHPSTSDRQRTLYLGVENNKTDVDGMSYACDATWNLNNVKV